jgi:hypothetical protein
MTELLFLLFTFSVFGLVYFTNKKSFDFYLTEVDECSPKVNALKKDLEKTIAKLKHEKDEAGLQALRSTLFEVQAKSSVKVTEVGSGETGISLDKAIEEAFNKLKQNEEVLSKSYAVIMAKKAVVDRQIKIFLEHADDHDFTSKKLDVREYLYDIEPDSPLDQVLTTVEKKAFQDVIEKPQLQQ